MAQIGVDMGGSYSGSLFNAGQSAGNSLGALLSGASGLKRQLLEDQHVKNLAYIDATNAKKALDVQEHGGRETASQMAADLERYRTTHGGSNAAPSGAAAPVPVDLNETRAKLIGAQQLLATGATDAAQGYNKISGGLGMEFGPKDQFRENYAMAGGSPTAGNVFGAWDKAGTNSTIAVEGAKTQGRIQQDAADVGNKIAVDAAKQQNELALDPMKNPDSVIYNLETEKYHNGGQLTPEKQAQLDLAKAKQFPQKPLEFEDKGTGEHVVRFGVLGGAPSIYPNKDSAPVPVDPNAKPAPTQSPAMPAPTAAPAVVGGAPNELRFGSPKPTAAPTDAQSHTYKYARAKLDAEATLQNFTQNTQIPSQMDAMIRAVQNSDMKAQQFWESLPDERSRAYFDAAYLFLIGTLRQESGAAIGMNEFAQRYPTLLPSAHATPEEIARKTNLRKSDIAGDFAMLPQHLQQEIDRHAARVGVKYHDADVPYVPPYSPPPPQDQPAQRGKPVITGVEEIFD